MVAPGTGLVLGLGARAGASEADLLAAIGTALSDPAAAQGAFAAAQASGSAQIQILRDGKRLTLTVPLR